MTVDLSTEAIEARQHAKNATGRDGGYTGSELIDAADVVLKRAHRLQQQANARRARGKRTGARKLDDQADLAMVQAAVQIRIAARVPLDRPYLHVLSLDQIQDVRETVARIFNDQGSARLAVLTHTMIDDQRARRRAERNA
jgi:hypothetical protein